MKTYNEFKSKAFDWLRHSSGLTTSLRYVMSWEPEVDCNTEIAIKYYKHDRHIFSQCVRKYSKYKIS